MQGAGSGPTRRPLHPQQDPFTGPRRGSGRQPERGPAHTSLSLRCPLFAVGLSTGLRICRLPLGWRLGVRRSSQAVGGPFFEAERGSLSLRPGPARRPLELVLERVCGPQRPPSDVGRDRGVDEPVVECGVVGLLGGLVAILGLLIGVLGGVVALLGAGMLGVPDAALLVELGLAAFGLLLTVALAL